MLFSSRIIVLVALLLTIPLLFAATDNADSTAPDQSLATQSASASPDLASPRDTLKTFFLHAEQVISDPSNRSSQMQLYGTLDIPETIGEQRTPIAVQLLGILNSIGSINPDEMAPGIQKIQEQKLTRYEFFPNNPNPKTRQLFQQVIDDIGSQPPGSIVITKTDSGEWKFSAGTLNKIAALWAWIEKRGVKSGADICEIDFTQKIRSRFVPEALKGRFVLGAELWQWLGLIVVLIIVLLTNALLAIILKPIASQIATKATSDPKNIQVHAAAKPLGLFVAAALFWLSLDILGFTGLPVLIFVVAIKLIVGYAVAWMAWAIVDVVSATVLGKITSEDSTFARIIIPLLGRTAQVIIVVAATIYAASALDINLIPLLGGLGIAGLAISFAAQDTVRNLFGSVMIFSDKPFNIGDLIQFGDITGSVEQIGFRSTKLRTFPGHLVTIPNGSITSDAVENISARKYILHMMDIILPLNTEPKKLSQAMQIIENIFKSEALYDSVHNTIDGNQLNPKVVFKEITNEGLKILVVYWYMPTDYFGYLNYNQMLNMEIVEEFAKENIQFAMPVRLVKDLEHFKE
jgi:MscS family membrane protein